MEVSSGSAGPHGSQLGQIVMKDAFQWSRPAPSPKMTLPYAVISIVYSFFAATNSFSLEFSARIRTATCRPNRTGTRTSLANSEVHESTRMGGSLNLGY